MQKDKQDDAVRIDEGDGEFDSLELDDVAKALHISRGHIYQMHKKGLIPTFYVGRSVRIRRTDLRQLIDQQVQGKFGHAA